MIIGIVMVLAAVYAIGSALVIGLLSLVVAALIELFTPKTREKNTPYSEKETTLHRARTS